MIRPTYDLRTEPWIPVVDLDGRYRHVGLREALLEAHLLREVSIDSPVETAALNRLLLALAVAIVPQTIEPAGWTMLWDHGALDPDMVDRYFAERDDRFDLLHPERPFYQHPVVLASKVAPVSKLFVEEASGNNATLFSHVFDEQSRAIPLDAAARGVVATQAAAIGGGVSIPFYLCHGPLVAGGAIFWIRGANLFESLLLNAPPSKEFRLGRGSAEMRKLQGLREDMPSWDRPLPAMHAQRVPEGFLDYLTWQSRRLLLRHEPCGDGSTCITGVWVTQGDKEKDPITNDPHMAYKLNKENGAYPYRFTPGRALWRDAALLFNTMSEEHGGGPRTFQWASSRDIFGERIWMVDALGMATDQSKIELWRRERFPLYTIFIESPEHRSAVEHALSQAEWTFRLMRNACSTFGAWLLCSGKLEQKLRDSGRGGAKRDDERSNVLDLLSTLERRDVEAFVRGLDAEERYWACLEVPFYDLLRSVAWNKPSDALPGWRHLLRRVAREAFEGATSTRHSTARELRALTEGRRIFERRTTIPSLQKEKPTV